MTDAAARVSSLRVGLAVVFSFFAAFSAHAQSISVSPATSFVAPGTAFTLDIVGSAFAITQGGGFSLTFDPLVLEVTNVSIEGAVWNFVNDPGTIDNIAGSVTDVNVSAFPGVATGNFVVASVEFMAKSEGISGLALSASSTNPWSAAGLPVNPTFDQSASAEVSASAVPALSAPVAWLLVSLLMTFGLRAIPRHKRWR